jgi:methionyl-tRNA formyltransferase
MRFAMTLTDRYLGVLQALVERGWEPVKLFTTSVDNRLHHNSGVIDFAHRRRLELQISRLTDDNLRELGERGCEALVVASYRWRIGEWRPHLKYALNFHPAPLPHGRGPYPLPVAILEQCASWGVSCHKLAHEFDSGEILKTVEFPLSPAEDHDSLDLKVQLAARQLGGDIAARLPQYWEQARPQSGGSYYPAWTPESRRLDFTQSVESILRRLRAFGPIECLARIKDTQLYVRRAVGWVQAHEATPGAVIYLNNLAMVVAAADGFVGLTEWSIVAPEAVTGSLRR